MRIRYQFAERRFEVELNERSGILHALVDGQALECELLRREPGYLVLRIGPRIVRAQVAALAEGWRVDLEAAAYELQEADRASAAAGGAGFEGRLVAPIPGKLIQLEVEAGSSVRRGQVVAILESMKMQTELRAPCDGRVERILAGLGNLIQAGATILEIRPAPDAR
ncbi:MAG TPA: biotin/lipoyl-containing protein [Acidobacteriota bacterium]